MLLFLEIQVKGWTNCILRDGDAHLLNLKDGWANLIFQAKFEIIRGGTLNKPHLSGMSRAGGARYTGAA